MDEWHNLSVQQVYRQTGSGRGGLSSEEAMLRLEKYGYNEFKEKKQVSLLEVFVRQFRSTLVLLLFLAAAVAIYLGEIAEAGVIFAVLLINAMIGTYHEYRAEKSLEALKKMQAQEVVAIRDGKDIVLNARDVVVGDLLLLRAGDRVPADGRVVEAALLKIDESTLTGESMPVEKTSEILSGRKQLAERRNMVYSGTFASSGRGLIVIVATDDETEIGRIYRGVAGERELFPLQIEINRFSGMLGKAALASIAIFVLFFGVVLGDEYGYNVHYMLELGIAQAVSFIPEGLPIVVTIALALGVSEMAKKRALSRKMQAVETIGKVDTICVDKTGTITVNNMSVRAMVIEGTEYKITGGTTLLENGKAVEGVDIPGFMRLLETGILCNDSSYDERTGKRTGEPLETALVEYALNFSLDREKYSLAHPRKAEVQFDPKNKYMVTVNRNRGQDVTYHLKGSPETVSRMCTRILDGRNSRSISPSDIKLISDKTDGLASKGLRVIAFAQKASQTKISMLDSGYTFLGLVGFQDPLRHDVPDAIKKAKDAGISVVMITGDHRITAETIAREAGIIHHESHVVLTGEEMDHMGDKELEAVIGNVRVFARVTSEHKAKIVKILKAQGRVVAMTGDGVNDAIALKDAHVGVALGSGTEVAKEASDIVITDDNFATIVDAVEEGRHSAANLRKVVKYLFATNIIEVIFLFAILLSPFWSGSLLPLALLPIHILYVNLVTDGVCDVTLATERKDRHLMKQKPKDFSGSLFPREVMKFIAVSAIIVCPCLFLTYLFYLDKPGVSVEHMRTMVFTLLVFFKFWAAVSARSIVESVFSIGFFTNRYLMGAISISIAAHLLVVYLPELNSIMKTAPLGLFDWAWILGVSSLLFVGFEALKVVERRGYSVLS